MIKKLREFVERIYKEYFAIRMSDSILQQKHEYSRWAIKHGDDLCDIIRILADVVEGVQKADRYANRRWVEWGERAENVSDMIDNALATADERIDEILCTDESK